MANPIAPPDVAGLGAQQVRRLHGSRAASARPRDGRADRSQHRVGDLEHAAVRDRFGEVDLDAVVEAAARGRRSRSTASTTTTCISPASTPSAAPPEWYRNVRKNDTSTELPLERVERAARQLSRSLQPPGIALVRDRRAQRQGSAPTDQFGTYRRYNNANADLYQTYKNGVPLRVTVLNTPLEVQENLDANFGIYAQDSWNLGKLTAELRRALRLPASSASSARTAMQGRFANVAAYDDIELPVWKDFSPRLSAVYNLVGRRQDGGARRLQQVRDRADDRLRAAL